MLDKQKAERAEVRGVFVKIFLWLLIFLIIMTSAALALFARQFISFYRVTQADQLSAVFGPLIRQLANAGRGLSDEGRNAALVVIAKNFHERNMSFPFELTAEDGSVLYATPDMPSMKALQADQLPPLGTGASVSGAPMSGAVSRFFFTVKTEGDRRYLLHAIFASPPAGQYGDLVYKSVLLLLVLFATGGAGAFVLARKVAQPLFEEISRRKQTEEARLAFFTGASHELKTPIAALQAVIEGMLAGIEGYKDRDKALNECLTILETQNVLCRQILEIVSLSDSETAPVFTSFSLSDFVDEAVLDYKSAAALSGITIVNEVLAPETIYADRRLLKSAFSNALSNAVKNSSREVRIWSAAAEDGGTRLCILNEGSISEDPFMFSPFEYSGGQSKKSGSKAGSGLGLGIIKKALDKMDVPFALTNTKAGVLFWLELKSAEVIHSKAK